MWPGLTYLYSYDAVGFGCFRRVCKLASALANEDADCVVIGHDYQTEMFSAGDFLQYGLPSGKPMPYGVRAQMMKELVDYAPPEHIITDMYPSGKYGELIPALKSSPSHNILVMRDIVAEPGKLLDAWTKSREIDRIREYYDEIWVFGLPQIHNDFEDFPEDIVSVVRFMGYVE